MNATTYKVYSKVESFIVAAANSGSFSGQFKLSLGGSYAYMRIAVTLTGGAAFSATVNEIVGDPAKLFRLNPAGEPAAVDSQILSLIARLQAKAKKSLTTITTATNEHKVVFLIPLDFGINTEELKLGLDESYERMEFELQLADQAEICPNLASWTDRVLTVDVNFEFHMSVEDNDSVGYRQYIQEKFGIDVKNSGLKVTRILQSHREIDSILIYEPPVELKWIRILKNTNEVVWEGSWDIIKEISYRKYGIEGNVGLIDPSEYIETGSDCVIEIELGEVTAPGQLTMLVEYLHHPEA
ncbi:MAG: hypothetical protein ACTSVZ_00280, partial [Promethearchaeota archaeon]